MYHHLLALLAGLVLVLLTLATATSPWEARLLGLSLGLLLRAGASSLSDSLAIPGCTCEAEAGSAPG